MKIPKSMQEELGTWNNGKGIDLEGWICGSGNFSLAVGYTTIFCPEFSEFEDYIFSGEALDEGGIQTLRGFESQEGSTPMSVEWVLNHIHIGDIHSLGCEDLTADKIVVLGECLKKIYEARLSYLFPEKPCTVEFYKPEDPDDLDQYQLSFWQNKHVPPNA